MKIQSSAARYCRNESTARWFVSSMTKNVPDHWDRSIKLLHGVDHNLVHLSERKLVNPADLLDGIELVISAEKGSGDGKIVNKQTYTVVYPVVDNKTKA